MESELIQEEHTAVLVPDGSHTSCSWPVTAIIRRKVRKRDVAAFDTFRVHATSLVSSFRGYQGKTIITPTVPPEAPEDVVLEFVVILYFDVYEHLRMWLQSDERKSLEGVGQQLFVQDDCDTIVQVGRGMEARGRGAFASRW